MLKEIIILTPFNVSAFWAVVFFSNRFYNNKARFWLGIFMLTSALLYACHAVFFHGYMNLYLKMDSLYLLTSLSVYPMYYIRLLTCDVSLKRSYLLHFIPAILFFLALLVTGQLLTVQEEQYYYKHVLLENKFPVGEPSGRIIAMAVVFFISRLIFGLQTLIYLYLGYRLVLKYNKQVANFYSNMEGRELIWVKLLLLSFLVTSVVSFVFNVLGRGIFMDSIENLTIPSVLFSLLLFFIGIQGNKQDFNISQFREDENQEINPESNLLVIRNHKIKQNLLYLLQNEKIYLNPELKITELCRLLNTNRTYLSKIINNDFQTCFNDLINKYRIEHTLSLINSDHNRSFSFQDLSDASGFGSLSSFNRAFKKYTGMTAGNYVNSQMNRTDHQDLQKKRIMPPF